MSAIAALLPDGRLHLQHGPIDCLCRAWGDAAEVRAGYAQAAAFFGTVLEDLCAELKLLRSPLPAPRPDGAIARAMHAACLPFADRFVTPMAAVAGAVADAVLAAMVRGRRLSRAFVNNGGDIAFHLEPGTSLRCGLVADLTAYRFSAIPSGQGAGVGLPHASCPHVSWPGLARPPTTCGAGPSKVVGGRAEPGHDAITQRPRTLTQITQRPRTLTQITQRPRTLTQITQKPRTLTQVTQRPRTRTQRPCTLATPPLDPPSLDGTFLLTADHPARGVATSGRACKGHGGRSFSFGIADSVSVLGRTAAQADAAATIIGNAVDLPGHSAIDRRPASAIDPASDLGERLITFDVGPLADAAIEAALDAGVMTADILRREGLIEGAVLTLRGRVRIRHSSLALQEVA